eukprot:GHVL01034608.1.p1 GENE.GHVL01034608.1~~GHVL01034608.1.p1  ORF type:complete len:206 (+),score=44.45 GHVL01034608.1:923-1540(+)
MIYQFLQTMMEYLIETRDTSEQLRSKLLSYFSGRRKILEKNMEDPENETYKRMMEQMENIKKLEKPGQNPDEDIRDVFDLTDHLQIFTKDRDMLGQRYKDEDVRNAFESRKFLRKLAEDGKDMHVIWQSLVLLSVPLFSLDLFDLFPEDWPKADVGTEPTMEVNDETVKQLGDDVQAIVLKAILFQIDSSEKILDALQIKIIKLD